MRIVALLFVLLALCGLPACKPPPAPPPVVHVTTNLIVKARNYRVVQTVDGKYWIEVARWRRLGDSLSFDSAVMVCGSLERHYVETPAPNPIFPITNGLINVIEFTKYQEHLRDWVPPYIVVGLPIEKCEDVK